MTKWGLGWKDVARGQAIILPILTNDNRVHSTIGLSVVELQGIDNETVVLVVEEKLPKSDRSITYGLILDLAKLRTSMCLTLTEKGLLYFPEDRAQWTSKHIQEQWDQIEEARIDSGPAPQPALEIDIEPTPAKKRATKQKSAVGPSGEEAVEVEAKQKRGKGNEPLTLQQCVTMSAVDIEKLDKAKQTEMKNLYSGAFEPLYKWGGEKLKDDDRKDVTVHFSKLHRAPQGSIVYRGLIEKRLRALTNQARINPRYTGTDREITVLSLKKGPYGSNKVVEFYSTPPDRNQLLKSTTHFFIIGGQHTVECYKNLVEAVEVDEADKAKASNFNIIPVFAPKADHLKLLLPSRVLNQDMAGPQKEATFMMQILNARIKWKEMNCPKPSTLRCQHTLEFLVIIVLPSLISDLHCSG